MWLFSLSVSLVGLAALLFHIFLELNTLDKSTNSLVESIKKHYESE